MGHVQEPPHVQIGPPGPAEQADLAYPGGQACPRGMQMPAEMTSFVGREAELAQLATLLDTARLVTVTGPGGVGKTRLALRVAARRAARYTGGVTLVDLSRNADRGLLRALTEALGEPAGSGDGQRLDVILDCLRDRRQLLILDTCEHMVDSCATLAAILLDKAPGVTILATSLQPLDVPGEHVLGLRPLPVPDRAGGGPDHGDAVDLFAQRAASVVPGFILTSDNLASVTEVCRMLDGFPLAIELAALRLRALSLRQLEQMAGDHDGLAQLTTGARRTAVSRHQTLRQLITWSLDLCTPAERAAWERLSVFGGSFDLATAETVCADADLPASEVIKAIIGLVDKSVLLREPTRGDAPPDLAWPDLTWPDSARPDPARPDPDWHISASSRPASEPASRYRLAHSVRQEGAGQLAKARRDAGSAVRARYVAHWTRVAERFAAHVIDDQVSQYRTVHRELHNLRTAFEYALAVPEATLPGASQAADDQPAARLAAALTMYWIISGDLREGRRWLDEATDRCRRPSSALARALAARAFLTATAGDHQTALADAEASIEMATGVGDSVARARGYVALNRVAAWSGDLARVARTATISAATLGTVGDVLGLVQVDIQSGAAYLPANPAACAEACERGLRRLPPGELWATSLLVGLTALRQFQDGDLETASESARRALAMKHQLGDAIGIAYGLEVLAHLAGAQGHHERAAWLLGAAAPIWEQAGVRYADNPLLREKHREMVRAALDTLGTDRYARLRDAGSAQPLEEAIALVARPLGELDLAVLAAGGPATPSAGRPQHSRQGQPGQPRQPHASSLTGREVQIAALVANGMSNREIAEHMVISKRTVDAHVDHIFSKLGIGSRVQLTIWLRDKFPQARGNQNEAERAP